MEKSLPIYKKIAAEITQNIYNGKYPSHSFLPSENQLARKFKVTRTTIRKALNILKQQGTIESFQGKGYKVKSLLWEQSLLHFYSFGLDIAEKISNSETHLVSLKKINGLQDVKEFIKTELWEISRLRKINGISIILETSYIPVFLIPKIDSKNLEQHSLYHLLENSNIQIVKARETLEPALPSLEVQKILGIDSDNPLFQTIRYTYNTKDELIELRESLIRGDHFRFSVEMTL